MQIQNILTTINFTAGLNNNLIKQCRSINPRNVESQLTNTKEINICLKNSFAETFTKLICDTLSKDCLPQRNPLDDLKHYPKEFLKILNKILSI